MLSASPALTLDPERNSADGLAAGEEGDSGSTGAAGSPAAAPEPVPPRAPPPEPAFGSPWARAATCRLPWAVGGKRAADGWGHSQSPFLRVGHAQQSELDGAVNF